MNLVYYDETAKTQWQGQLITCYKEVFAAAPWNEDWWTDQLVCEVLDRYAGPNARIIVAIEDAVVVGFSWGAVWSSQELSLELELDLPTNPTEIVGYIKDIGIKLEYRNRNIATTLLRELYQKLKTDCAENSVIYARTLSRPEPSVVYHWFPRHGFEVVAEYSSESERDGQVILASPMSSFSF